jgi:hypothetical protein
MTGGEGMIVKIINLLKKPITRISLGVLILILFGGAVWGTWQAQIPPSQPIQFPHNKHINQGIPCLYCHPGALRGISPGLPTAAKCYACHQQLEVTSSELDILKNDVESNETIAWVPVAILPDFVYFSHRPHIAAGLNCENCHGEVAQMTVAEPQKMNMGWCLECHRTRHKDEPVVLTKLTDCENCHK